MFIGHFTERPYQDPKSGFFGATGTPIMDLTVSNESFEPRLAAGLYNRYLDEKSYAEEMGFDEVWFVEHHFLTEWAHSSASEVMLSVLSQHTTKMRLGFGVVLLPVHHPLHVAVKASTLVIMSGGRVDVGVGCLLYTSPSPRDRGCARMQSSA